MVASTCAGHIAAPSHPAPRTLPRRPKFLSLPGRRLAAGDAAGLGSQRGGADGRQLVEGHTQAAAGGGLVRAGGRGGQGRAGAGSAVVR